MRRRKNFAAAITMSLLPAFAFSTTLASSPVTFSDQAMAHPSHHAEAPTYKDVSLDAGEAGGVFALNLSALNESCNRPVDFRFRADQPWLSLPDDAVVRRVEIGQVKNIMAVIDTAGMAPGAHTAIVDVNCENCASAPDTSCNLEKQAFRLNVPIIASADQQIFAPQPQPVAATLPTQARIAAANDHIAGPDLAALRPSHIAYNDRNIPNRLRRAVKTAHARWEKALKKSNAHEQELATLREVARKTQIEADEASLVVKTAQSDIRNAIAREDKAKADHKMAVSNHRQAYNTLKAAQTDYDRARGDDGTFAEFKRAKAALADAQNAALNADEKLKTARENVGLFKARDLKKMERGADKKRKTANAAQRVAEKAHDAAEAKAIESLSYRRAAAAAEAAHETAEQKALTAMKARMKK